MPPADGRAARSGAAAGLAAFLAWALLPLYYKWFEAVPATEILAHRAVWSVAVAALLVAALRRGGEVAAVLRRPRSLAVFAGSAAMIGVNWGLYIWSVVNHRLVEASMGYFVYPLVAVALGAVLLRERLRPRQTAAVGLVAAGVAYLAWSLGEVPWVALALATTFALYGLLRKIAQADSLAGLFVETSLMAPAALVYLVMLGDGGAFAQGGAMAAMLALAGPATALPLLLFAFAARRLRMATLGLMQYINPSIQLALAALLFGESFTASHLAAFSCIWAGLLVYSSSAWRRAA